MIAVSNEYEIETDDQLVIDKAIHAYETGYNRFRVRDDDGSEYVGRVKEILDAGLGKFIMEVHVVI
jgi:hypothetical protein